MAHELPCPALVHTCIEVNSSAGVAPAVARPENCASIESSKRKCQLCKGRLSTHAPAIDLIRQVGNMLPARTTVLAFVDGEVWWLRPRVGGGSQDCTILELDESWVRNSLSVAGLEDGIIHKEAERFRSLSQDCGTLSEERNGNGGEANHGGFFSFSGRLTRVDEILVAITFIRLVRLREAAMPV
jgi:hypothetical protein